MPEAIFNAGELRKIFELVKRSILWVLVKKKKKKRYLLYGSAYYQEFNCIFNSELLMGCEGS